MNKAEILIIDDEPQIRKLLEITLESNEYKVWQAETGKEGVIMAANHPPEMIILDIGLPIKADTRFLKNYGPGTTSNHDPFRPEQRSGYCFSP